MFRFMRLLRPAALAAGAAALIALAACQNPVIGGRAPQPGDVAVAKVAGETVWASDVKREAVAQGLIGEGEPLDRTSDLFRRVLDEVVDQKLLAREARRRGLDKSPLAQRRLAAAKERILGDMLVEKTVDDNIDEDKVQALYNEQLRLAKQSEEIRARLILVKSQQEAQAIANLLQTGASFEALAMERSIDQTTRFNGGDLGYFTTDVMPENYAAALKSAKAGETVGPFQTDGGWAILRVEDRREEQPLSLEQARPQILRFLTYDQVRQLLSKLRAQSKVQILIKGDSLAAPGAAREPASAPPDALRPPEAAPGAAASSAVTAGRTAPAPRPSISAAAAAAAAKPAPPPAKTPPAKSPSK
ncbi:MAG TPA: peptidylprolyl isomerase [Caulobacteraceae bacterium]|jgi:peptidyl-prolyl cis-trans isomerase C|nr:peptidylprolyl isomerase [Caulobacteraceae bacterium]